MARNSISNVVLEASQVPFVGAFNVHGGNEYTIDFNFLSWDRGHAYNIKDIAPTFGSRREAHSPGVVGSAMNDVTFACGDAEISAFDFGLLYTVFNGMITAWTEYGSVIWAEESQTWHYEDKHYTCLWLVTTCIIYSADSYLIVPIKSSDVEKALSGQRCSVKNFCDGKELTLDSEGNKLVLTNSNGEILLMCNISEEAQKRYVKEESSSGRTAEASLIPGSPLATLIASSDTRDECKEVLLKYQSAPTLESVVARADLIVVPEQHYSDTTNFFGSICYTDKEDIVVAVNFRRGLFVCYPWFPFNSNVPDEIQLDENANFQEFYNVTDGCNRITRYAKAVSTRPLSAAQFDFQVVEHIREKFLHMELPRIPLQSAFGKVVIPESILVSEVLEGNGESAYCFVPVGVVGTKVICVEEDNKFTALSPKGWDLSSALYDITEVAKNV